MTTLIETIAVQAPLEAAFELAADFSRLHEWDPSVVHSDLASGATLRKGAVIDVGVRFLGATARLRYELTAIDPPHFVEYVGRGRTVVSTDRIRFTQDGSVTTIEFSADIEFHSYGRLLKPLIVLVSRGQADAALSGLKTRLG